MRFMVCENVDFRGSEAAENFQAFEIERRKEAFNRLAERLRGWNREKAVKTIEFNGYAIRTNFERPFGMEAGAHMGRYLERAEVWIDDEVQ